MSVNLAPSEIACPVCRSLRARKPAVRLSYGAIGTCPDCGSGILEPRPSQQALSEIHGTEEYFNHPYFELRRDITPGIRRALEARLDRIEAHTGQLTGKALLDVGCDIGHFVEHAQSTRGAKTIGIDVSERAVESGRARGRDLRHGTLADVGLADGSIDVVCGFDVIEHVEDPRELVQEAARVLKPKGFLALETPNYGGLIYRIGRGLGGLPGIAGLITPLQERLWPRFHVQYFRETALRDLLNDAGFEAVHTELREFENAELAVDNIVLRAGVQGVFLASRLIGAPTLLCAFARKA